MFIICAWAHLIRIPLIPYVYVNWNSVLKHINKPVNSINQPISVSIQGAGGGGGGRERLQVKIVFPVISETSASDRITDNYWEDADNMGTKDKIQRKLNLSPDTIGTQKHVLFSVSFMRYVYVRTQRMHSAELTPKIQICLTHTNLLPMRVSGFIWMKGYK